MLALFLKRTSVPGMNRFSTPSAVLAASPFGTGIASILDQSSVFPETAPISTRRPSPEALALFACPSPVVHSSTERALDCRQQFVQLEGFLQEAVDFLLEQLRGYVSKNVPAHENDEGVDASAADPFQDLRKAPVRENQVQENEIEVILGQQDLCLPAAESSEYFGVEDAQEHFQALAQRGVVINDEDLGPIRHGELYA
jgi:hypothetical protein